MDFLPRAQNTNMYRYHICASASYANFYARMGGKAGEIVNEGNQEGHTLDGADMEREGGSMYIWV